jgi:N-methylhydantoinase A
VDIGGTFTDIVFLGPNGEIHTKKVSSSVEDYAIAEGLREVFREAAIRGSEVGEIILGTTVASNANGQSFELTVPVGPGRLDARAVAELEEGFGREHERTYGHRAGPDEPVELVSLRLFAQGLPERPRFPDRIRLDRDSADESSGHRPVYFGPEHGWLEAPILRRRDLATGRTGPCIVEEYDATCVVPPELRADLNAYGNIIIELVAE